MSFQLDTGKEGREDEKGKKRLASIKLYCNRQRKFYARSHIPKYILPFANISPFIAIPYFLAKMIKMNLL